MTILGVHEFGHYFAARRFGVDATLPYFIPFPSIVGTMGAVIKTKSPIPHRRALFYIGVMGPIPGFIVSLAAVIVGIMLSEIQPLPPAEGITPVFGDSILFGFIVHLFHSEIPAGFDIALHPFAWAGWIGFLVTSLNLIPIGQLDGGHILYSLLGRKQVMPDGFPWRDL
jgi:Predicted membrane-associated Zn-dependent proteases 1